MPQVKNCSVTDMVGSTGKLLNEVYLLPGFAFPSRDVFNEGLRWLAERLNKNPIFGVTYSAGLDPKLEMCHLQALNVKKIPCCPRAPGPLCSSPSPRCSSLSGAAVPGRSK